MGSRPFPAVTGDYRRQAAYAAYLLILVFIDSFTETKKPRWLGTHRGFSPLRKAFLASLPDRLSRKAYLICSP